MRTANLKNCAFAVFAKRISVVLLRVRDSFDQVAGLADIPSHKEALEIALVRFLVSLIS